MNLSELALNQLHLSTRAYNGLHRAGIDTAEKMVQLSEADLMQIQNLGKKTVEEILTVIQQLKNGNSQPVLSEDETNPKNELESIGFSVRLMGVLTRMGLSKINEIISLTDEQLMSQKNMGKTSLLEFHRWRTQYLLNNPAFVQTKAANSEPAQLNIGKLKRTILAIYRDAGFRGYSLDEIRKQTDPEELVDPADIKKAIGQLLAEKELEYVDFRCYRTYPSFCDYIKEVPKIDDRNRAILQRRLAGDTLEAIGKDNGSLTRERVRQICNKAICNAEKYKLSYTGTALFDEDYYRYFYETYLPDQAAYINWLGISAETWNYLEMRYKRGGKNLEESLGDNQLDIPLRLKIQSYLNRDKVFIDNVLVKKSRAELEVAALRKLCTDKTSLNDFRSQYNQFLQELKILDEKLYITDETIRTRQNKLADSPFVLWNYFSSFRYYDIGSRDYTKLLDTLGLESYEDVELSTLKLWDENPEIMAEYDIRDQYELHNLLKKIVPAGSYHNFQTSRMPIIQFGKPDMESMLLELLVNNAPIEINAFANLIRQEFGYEQASFISSPEMNALKVYYHNGILNIEQKVMSLENQAKLKQALTEDFYFIDELKRIYSRAVPDAHVDEINPYNLKVLGFIVLSRYAVRNHSSLDEYIRKLLLKKEVTDLVPLRKRYGYVMLFSQVLMELKRSYEVVEFEPNQIVAFRRLARMGVTKEMLHSYCDQVYNFMPSGQYFTAQYLRAQGFQSGLYDLGFDDWFYAQVLAADPRFANTQVFGNIILCANTKQITIQTFLVSLIQEYGSVDVLDLISDMEKDYGFTGLQLTDIVYRTKNAGIFYDDVLQQLYADKEQYYWELDNQEAMG